MKRRGFIAYLFIFISIVMLTASVYPHHHHLQKICPTECCLSHVETDSYENAIKEHHHHCNNECKENACITQFECPLQATNEETIELPTTDLFYTSLNILLESITYMEGMSKVFPIYLEHLYNNPYIYIIGLRAPPIDL